MSIDLSPLLPLGWSNFFSTQIPFTRLESVRPARVVRVERDRYRVDPGSGELTATLAGRLLHGSTGDTLPTVGDWVLLDAEHPVITERLERRTVISRREAGGIETQAIAANVDLMVVVSGLDAEFNLHRIERYLVVAAQARVTPLVLLTKADLTGDRAHLIDSVRARLPPAAEVIAVNALQDPLGSILAPWLGAGATLVVVGSSGVGKSTVVNNLAGTAVQSTAATGADAKGRHTTTSRSLVRLPGGACIIDVPGMREVGLAAEGGADRQFRTIAELATGCRFSDCTHQAEPGCDVRAAVERGEVAPDEWEHYLKLRAEERHHVAEHERRRREREFCKMVRGTVENKKRERGR